MHNTGTGNVHNAPAKPDARVKLSKAAKAEIVERVEAGESQAQVAADYGVDQPRLDAAPTQGDNAEAQRKEVPDGSRTLADIEGHTAGRGDHPSIPELG